MTFDFGDLSIEDMSEIERRMFMEYLEREIGKTGNTNGKEIKKDTNRPEFGSGDVFFSTYYSLDGNDIVYAKEEILPLEDDIITAEKQCLKLVPRLTCEEKTMRTGFSCVYYSLDFRVGEDKLYIIKDLGKFVRSMQLEQRIEIGKRLVIDGANAVFEPGISAKLWEMLLSAKVDEDILNPITYYSGGYYDERFSTSRIFDCKYLKLTATTKKAFLDIMGDTPFETVFIKGGLWTEKYKYTDTLSYCPGNPDIKINVESKRKWTYITITKPGIMHIDKAGNENYIISTQGWHRVSNEYADNLQEMLECFEDKDELKIDNRRTWEFISRVVPHLEKVAQVNIAAGIEEKYQRLPLEVDLYVDYCGDGIAVRPVFKYGFEEYNPLIGKLPDSGNTKIIVGDDIAEQRVLKVFLQCSFAVGEGEWKGWYVQPDEARAYDFVVNVIPALREQANIHCVELKEFVTSPQSISIGVRINDKSILELSAQGKKYNFAELMEIFASYRRRRRYHRLKDGRFMPLGNQQLEKLSGIMEMVEKKNIKDDVVQLPVSRAMYLDELGRGEDGVQLERNRRFKSVVQAIRHPEVLEPEIPESLQNVLREYQVVGVNWLSSLAKHGLGGILADDMGLGKTLQVITFIMMKKNESLSGIEPVLVVTPTSLMYNWLEEIEKFAPELSAVAIAGTKEKREEILQDISSHDLIITTYNMLTRDVDIYSEKFFSCCFLDEAQHIKNPTTQKAKAVKKLQAGGYYALTGTPIENTLTELWSIFDFIMPGYLYAYDKFRREFEVPIVRAQDKKTAEKLSRFIKPFVLRRLKKDVLKELPEKLERRMLNEMTQEQSKIYDAYFVQAKKELVQELKKNGFEKSRIKILALLTRLRQIACDPSIFLEDYVGGSGKLDMLEELVEEAVGGGHRILIFSQFTTMLQKIGQRLGQMEVSFDYLDGSTPAKERMRLVKSFNSDIGGNPVFLISLKAGGTGLNLTGADMVIHYDPWWNPAVEDQATDRAYRIGQQRNVQVIKMITKGTIEEQIYELQEKKKALIDQMIQPGETFLSKLSEEEIQNLFK